MRRIVFMLVAFCAMPLAWPATPAAAQTPNPPERSITCDAVGGHTARLYRTLLGRRADDRGLGYWVGQRRSGLTGEDVALWMTRSVEYELRYGAMSDEQFVDAVYLNLLGRPADAGGRGYWIQLVAVHGRAAVASWMTQTEEFGQIWPFHRSTICDTGDALGLIEAAPGIIAGRRGATVTVIADPSLVDLRAVDGPRTYAGNIVGDVVVNANWFTPAGPVGPVVTDHGLAGSADTVERGQIVVNGEGCGGRAAGLHHIWTGEIYHPEPCVTMAVSGVSLVHKGLRADAYPGITITTGPTNTSPAHSFLGFGPDRVVVISSTSLTAPRLADYALSLGVVEGVMLDGGGSTQISTRVASLGASRAVPTFAVVNSRHRWRG